MSHDIPHELEIVLQALSSGLPVPHSAIQRFDRAATASVPLTAQQVPTSSFEALVALANKEGGDGHAMRVLGDIWATGEIKANIASNRQVKRCARAQMVHCSSRLLRAGVGHARVK